MQGQELEKFYWQMFKDQLENLWEVGKFIHRFIELSRVQSVVDQYGKNSILLPSDLDYKLAKSVCEDMSIPLSSSVIEDKDGRSHTGYSINVDDFQRFADTYYHKTIEQNQEVKAELAKIGISGFEENTYQSYRMNNTGSDFQSIIKFDQHILIPEQYREQISLMAQFEDHMQDMIFLPEEQIQDRLNKEKDMLDHMTSEIQDIVINPVKYNLQEVFKNDADTIKHIKDLHYYDIDSTMVDGHLYVLIADSEICERVQQLFPALDSNITWYSNTKEYKRDIKDISEKENLLNQEDIQILNPEIEYDLDEDVEVSIVEDESDTLDISDENFQDIDDADQEFINETKPTQESEFSELDTADGSIIDDAQDTSILEDIEDLQDAIDNETELVQEQGSPELEITSEAPITQSEISDNIENDTITEYVENLEDIKDIDDLNHNNESDLIQERELFKSDAADESITDDIQDASALEDIKDLEDAVDNETELVQEQRMSELETTSEAPITQPEIPDNIEDDTITEYIENLEDIKDINDLNHNNESDLIQEQEKYKTNTVIESEVYNDTEDLAITEYAENNIALNELNNNETRLTQEFNLTESNTTEESILNTTSELIGTKNNEADHNIVNDSHESDSVQESAISERSAIATERFYTDTDNQTYHKENSKTVENSITPESQSEYKSKITQSDNTEKSVITSEGLNSTIRADSYDATTANDNYHKPRILENQEQHTNLPDTDTVRIDREIKYTTQTRDEMAAEIQRNESDRNIYTVKEKKYSAVVSAVKNNTSYLQEQIEKDDFGKGLKKQDKVVATFETVFGVHEYEKQANKAYDQIMNMAKTDVTVQAYFKNIGITDLSDKRQRQDFQKIIDSSLNAQGLKREDIWSGKLKNKVTGQEKAQFNHVFGKKAGNTDWSEDELKTLNKVFKKANKANENDKMANKARDNHTLNKSLRKKLTQMDDATYNGAFTMTGTARQIAQVRQTISIAHDGILKAKASHKQTQILKANQKIDKLNKNTKVLEAQMKKAKKSGNSIAFDKNNKKKIKLEEKKKRLNEKNRKRRERKDQLNGKYDSRIKKRELKKDKLKRLEAQLDKLKKLDKSAEISRLELALAKARKEKNPELIKRLQEQLARLQQAQAENTKKILKQQLKVKKQKAREVKRTKRREKLKQIIKPKTKFGRALQSGFGKISALKRKITELIWKLIKIIAKPLAIFIAVMFVIATIHIIGIQVYAAVSAISFDSIKTSLTSILGSDDEIDAEINKTTAIEKSINALTLAEETWIKEIAISASKKISISDLSNDIDWQYEANNRSGFSYQQGAIISDVLGNGSTNKITDVYGSSNINIVNVNDPETLSNTKEIVSLASTVFSVGESETKYDLKDYKDILNEQKDMWINRINETTNRSSGFFSKISSIFKKNSNQKNAITAVFDDDTGDVAIYGSYCLSLFEATHQTEFSLSDIGVKPLRCNNERLDQLANSGGFVNGTLVVCPEKNGCASTNNDIFIITDNGNIALKDTGSTTNPAGISYSSFCSVDTSCVNTPYEERDGHPCWDFTGEIDEERTNNQPDRYDPITKKLLPKTTYYIYEHNCSGHSGSWCAGHITVGTTGYVHSIPKQYLGENAVSIVDDLEERYLAHEAEFTNDNKTTINDANISIGDTIFECDLNIKHSYIPGSWRGWTTAAMSSAINKYELDWEKFYGITFKDVDVQALLKQALATVPSGTSGNISGPIIPFEGPENFIDTVTSIISSHEGGYASVNPHDACPKDANGQCARLSNSYTGDERGAISVGKVQWHGNRALNLLKMIINANPTNAKSILGDTLYSEITTSTNWTTRHFSDSSDIKRISALLNTEEGHSSQDQMKQNDVSGYCATAQAHGITDLRAVAYLADIINQYGSVRSNVYDMIVAAGGDLDSAYNITLANGYGQYEARRTAVYNQVKQAFADYNN